MKIIIKVGKTHEMKIYNEKIERRIKVTINVKYEIDESLQNQSSISSYTFRT